MSMELIIRRRLNAADASPFIAHVTLSAAEEEKVRAGLVVFVGRKADRIAAALELFPAAASWFLASNLARLYRSDTGDGAPTSKIYPHIARAFCVDAIDQSHRPVMARAFRRAARRFGLVLPPDQTNFHADAYVCQAGIAKAQLPALVRAFLKAEALFGAPPDEDTQRLNMWEVRSAQAFALGLSRLQNIMVWDESAYHAGCFARARRGDLGWPLAQDMVDAISKAQADGHIHSQAIEEKARIALIDSIPAVVAPSRAAVEVRSGERTRSIAAGRSWEIPSPWPERVTVSPVDSDDQSFTELHFLPTLQSIAFFDADSGVMIGSLTGGGKAAAIDAREVAIASRCPFFANGKQSQQVANQAHILFLAMEDGVGVELGELRYTLTPPMRPKISLDATRIAMGSGGGLFTHPSILRVRFPDGMPETATLSIAHPALPGPISVALAESLEPIDLGHLLPKVGPVGRLSMAITLGDGGRTIVRSSHWVWPGLTGLDGFAFDGPVPANFVAGTSENIAEGGYRLGLDASSEWTHARIAFDNEGRTISFTLARPGRSVSIVDDFGRERPHPMGGRITILPNSAERLIIRTDEHSARLIIRGQTEESSFGLSGVRRIALSSLTQSGSDNRILYLPDGEIAGAEVIAELGLSTEPQDFTMKHSTRSNAIELSARLEIPIDAVRLKVTNLNDGEPQEWVAGLGRRPVDGSHTPFLHGSVEFGANGLRSSLLSLSLDDRLAHECCVGELSVRLEGEERFRELRNMRGDAFLFLFGGVPELTTAREYLAACDLLSRCIAPETWSLTKPIVTAWREAGRALAAHGRWGPLLKGWGAPLPAGQATSWVPLQHPVEIDPALLSIDLVYFHAFGTAGDGTDELYQLYRLASVTRVREATGVLLVDPSFLFGFANWQQAANSNVRLRDFSFDQLLTTRRLLAAPERVPSSWRPTDGRLTDWHHEWCIERFIERFQMFVPDDTSNHLRSVQLNRVITAGARDHKGRSIPVSDLLGNRCQLGHGVAPFFSAAAKAWRFQKFPLFLNELSQRTGSAQAEVLENIGLLLRLAPEVIAFYLLLWELVRMTERH